MSLDAPVLGPPAEPSAEQVRVVRGGRSATVGTSVMVAVLVGLAVLPYLVTSATLSSLITLFVYVIIAVTWNLLAGYGGMVSVGQQAYIGLGAYGLVVLSDLVGVDPFLAVPLAAVVAGLVSIPVSFLAFRLVGGYFAIGTWVIAEVFRLVVVQFPEVGAGSGTSLRSLAGTDAGLRIAFTYWCGLIVLVLVVAGTVWLVSSRLGIALTAVRDDTTAAASNGIDVTRVKRVVFVVSAAGAGAAGALLALSSLRVQPDSVFSVQWTAFMVFMVVIGGVGTLEGPLVGALVFFALQETLSDLGSVYLVILGVVAILVVLFAPRGLWGLLDPHRRYGLFPVGHRLASAVTRKDARATAGREAGT
jgi:branched-chain amino acid transport system permease protein